MKKGHTFKLCKKPIVSFGILCYKRIKEKMYFLLIQRKDSMGFIDFVRGKYGNNDTETTKLQTLKIFIEEMTSHEKHRLLNSPFDELWDSLWLNKDSRTYLNDKEDAKKKFSKLDLQNLLNNTETKWDYQEYGIPKGRRMNQMEGDIDCSSREFKEETGIGHMDYIIRHDLQPVTENFLGSNGVTYKHVYFLAEYIGSTAPRVDKKDKIQAGEVKSVGWFTLKESFEILREYDTAKKHAILEAWIVLRDADEDSDDFSRYRATPTTSTTTTSYSLEEEFR